MVKNVNYWYNAQIRHLVLHTQRLFSNFFISVGKDENGEDRLKRVPVVFMTSDKSVASIINKNTDTIIETAPKMVLTIADIRLNNEMSSGSPYYEFETEVTEKRFDEEAGNYVYEPGNSYHIKRLNPVPIGFTFRLYVLTTKLEQKFQLLEQIRALFTPTLELQTSENPLDWTRLTAITLTNLNWTSRGVSNLDSTTLDTMDMTFEVNTNLDLPALVTRNQMIQQIISDMGEATNREDMFGWNLNDIIRTYYTPTETSIIVSDNNKIQLVPNGRFKTWYDLFKLYGIRYNAAQKNTYVHCITNYDIDNPQEIYGSITISNSDPSIADWILNEDGLPSENLEPVEAIIDPHSSLPKNIEGERYLITEPIANNTKVWGELFDKYGQKIESIPANCIIEYTDGKWHISLNPKEEPAVYYVRDNSDAKYLYTWNDDYGFWVDIINRKYRAGFWRISQI